MPTPRAQQKDRQLKLPSLSVKETETLILKLQLKWHACNLGHTEKLTEYSPDQEGRPEPPWCPPPSHSRSPASPRKKLVHVW